jgi:hypothetical protein
VTATLFLALLMPAVAMAFAAILGIGVARSRVEFRRQPWWESSIVHRRGLSRREQTEVVAGR